MRRFVILATLVIGFIAWVFPTEALAGRRGGSFGGSRGGYSRSFGGRSKSFGGSRTSPSKSSRPSQRSSGYSSPTSRNSFGGTRMSRPSDYTSRYGMPRKTETRSFNGPNGTRSNYVINQYGGMGDGFMMGYMLGSIPWYWSMPFHPAFYFSRPHTVVNSDGSTGVYPGTFQWGTLFLTLLIIGAIGFGLYIWLKKRRSRLSYAGAYDSDDYVDNSNSDARKSSFM